MPVPAACGQALDGRPCDRRSAPCHVAPGLVVALAAVATVLALALVAGCESEADRSKGPAPQGVVTILFSGDNRGVLSSCGCPSNPSGGFAKRQTVVEEMRRTKPNVLVVDAGDMFHDRPNAVKVKYLAKAVGRAKYDAIAVGDFEFELGVPQLQAMAREYKLPLICANVRDEAGNLVFPPHVVREIAGLRVGIFAVIAEGAQAFPPKEWHKGLTIEPPIEAAKREVRDLAGCDLVVALSHQPMAGTQELAKSVPGIQVVVSGHDETVLRKPVNVGDAVIVGTGAVGRLLGVLTFSRVPDGRPTIEMETKGLTAKVQDSKWVMDLYWEYVKKSKGEPPPDWDLTPVPAAYESAEKCAKCHETEHKQWLTTRHSHAYDSIKGAGRQEDPECILCHTMGYGRESGFISIEKTPDLGRVTCQACHPVTVSHHAEGMKDEPHFRIDSRLCMSCHGLIESPDFDYARYKTKIVHRAPEAVNK
jgi:hypothetical protein